MFQNQNEQPIQHIQVKVEPGTTTAAAASGIPRLPILLPSDCEDALPLKSEPGVDDALPETFESPVKKSKTAIEDIFGDVFVTAVEAGQSLNQRLQQELESYQKVPTIPICDSPLNWWKVHEQSYPLLAYVAKALLCIPATSVPSERVFSTAGDVVNAQRATLTPENVDMLVFLKKTLTF